MKKFSWKKFFRLTISKVILTMVIFIISFLCFSQWFMMGWICTDPTPQCEELKQSEAYNLLPIYFVFSIIFLWPLLIKFGAATGFIFSIIWIYFLSCLIVFIYNKFKK